MGFEVRAVVRPRTSPSTPAANFAMASRRDGRYDCGPAVLALARGNIRAVLPDEEDHKRIIGSAAVAAMGANSLGRRAEIIGDPPHKRATLIPQHWPRVTAVRVRIPEKRGPL